MGRVRPVGLLKRRKSDFLAENVSFVFEKEDEVNTHLLPSHIVNSIENRYTETLLSEERKVSAPSQETLLIIA